MPGQTQDSELTSPARPRESPFALGVRRILRARSSRVALVVLVIIVLVGLLAPFIAPYDPAAQPDIVALKDLPPSLAHPFGTDPYSRDVLSRVIYGARLSLLIGVLATIVSLTLGVAYGVNRMKTAAKMSAAAAHAPPISTRRARGPISMLRVRSLPGGTMRIVQCLGVIP